MPNANDHPVWEVYDLQRTCRLNFKYWSRKLVALRKWNFWMEYALAVTAPGSAVAGFVFWQTQSGGIVWSVLTIATAFLGIAKPLLKLSDHVQTLQKVVTGYRGIEFPLEQLGKDIRRDGTYSPEMVQTFKRLENQLQEVTRDEPVVEVDEVLRQQCVDATNRELPEASFFVPPARIDPPEPWKR
jgi:hypothetical protein